MASAYPSFSQKARLYLPKTINRIMERLNGKSLPLTSWNPIALHRKALCFKQPPVQHVSNGYHSTPHLSVSAEMTGCDWLIMTSGLHNFSPPLISPIINSSEGTQCGQTIGDGFKSTIIYIYIYNQRRDGLNPHTHKKEIKTLMLKKEEAREDGENSLYVHVHCWRMFFLSS